MRTLNQEHETSCTKKTTDKRLPIKPKKDTKGFAGMGKF